MQAQKIKTLFFRDIPRYAKHFSESKFFAKLLKIGSYVAGEVLLPMLRLYYVMKAPTTPLHRKLHIAAALGYFILPFDFIPDFLVPVLGFADDLVVATTVLKTVSGYCTDEIEDRARQTCERILSKCKK
ncbi:YkvA family protein [Porphyromonas sp.]|uniref:YkvA family protein n=1 Tax=Porphyromonas sp. TaxID=1924944 RepID=UPI0026DAC674|nr:YkvA family protein [Porphyromonas sp.]MDO4771289.1 YkvA family protein [Porphyromonas sp.]